MELGSASHLHGLSGGILTPGPSSGLPFDITLFEPDKVMLIMWRHPDRTTATFSKGKIIECGEREIVLNFALLTRDLWACRLCLFNQSWKEKQNDMKYPSNPWTQWTGWPWLLSQYMWLGVLNPSNYWHGALVLWQLFQTFSHLYCFVFCLSKW